jgi:hypothetical protein
MNEQEARGVLRAHLDSYRAQSYRELQRLLGAPMTAEVTAPSGTGYQIEVQAVWDDEPGGRLRVVGGISDRGWQSFTPLIEAFVATPDSASSASS